MADDNGKGSEPSKYDALIVGAGFGGVYQLKRLRDEGFKVKLVESGSDFGGIWYWNRYPGARVDIPAPLYSFSDPELRTDWAWKQRFPGSAELRDYFQYVADKWDLRKNCIFNNYVNSAKWNDQTGRCTIQTSDGRTFDAQYFLPNTGFSAKRYILDWIGIDEFKGTFLHPSYWPHEEPDLTGKKVAVIGTGASGVQLTQTLAPIASEFTLFQRTPNMALPMGQVNRTGQSMTKEEHEQLFAGRKATFGGLDFDFLPRATFDDDYEKRRETYDGLWKQGDFHFWLATYYDMLFSDEANDEAYNFWLDKTRSRIHDPRMKDKLAPMKKPHAFGTKRASLEIGYYEIFNQPHVNLVDVADTPIQRITPDGIKTTEKEWQFDYIICATGFDSLTGGLLQMGIVGRNGLTLNEKWKNGVQSLMGVSVAEFPNMFYTYGPQAPTPLCNGPFCAESQGGWIVNLVNWMRNKNYTMVDAQRQGEKKWVDECWAIANKTLLPTTKSWYMGYNIPGKPIQPLMYLGGIPLYTKILRECAEKDYAGFDII